MTEWSLQTSKFILLYVSPLRGSIFSPTDPPFRLRALVALNP
jgi:hypothetical protein